ncbi:hypothetical protein NM688_g5072 [Phlebia brevispora]|uniref:Uncharacterized protein n=1 Tax=Phlebia brevispora TaxID=194682 RepID=A0ACC1T154_9APHY|nr:hypothetical protein NM688_g5072 [Phlebia brevispora]
MAVMSKIAAVGDASRPLTRAQLKALLEDPALIQLNFEHHPLLVKALESEWLRDNNNEGDLEPGQYLDPVTPRIHRSQHSQSVPLSPAHTASSSAPRHRQASRTSPSVMPHTAEDSLPKNAAAVRKTTPHQERAEEVEAERSPLFQSSIVARHAYIGLRREKVEVSMTARELVEKRGYTLVEWNGRDTVALLDNKVHVLGLLAGGPKDPTYWNDAVPSATRAMCRAAKTLNFPLKALLNRREAYPSVAVGVSFGGGQRVPGNLRHSKHNACVIDDVLLNNDGFKRIAHYHTAMMALYAPKMYQDYHVELDKLYEEYPTLKHIFPRSVFPAASFNFGPNAVTYSHVDHLNRAIGWCAITALGNYDWKRSGHLVLESFRLIIEFPLGATILIPSATCVHSNTPIQRGESRMAFTQYAAGGLFRFVDYGFRTWKTLKAEDRARADRIEATRDTRWFEELKLYSRVNELHEDRKACGVTS